MKLSFHFEKSGKECISPSGTRVFFVCVGGEEGVYYASQLFS